MIPKHVAIIMDGNGRWATQKGLPRTVGHKEGAKILKPLLEFAKHKGIEVITLYAFSSENWNRPKEEVDVLLKLFEKYLYHDFSDLKDKNYKISFIGERFKFPDSIQKQMNFLEQETAENKGFHLVLALSYGGRADILNATKKIVHAIQMHQIQPQDITESYFSAQLSTQNIIPPDLVIRTSGEERISNFLLWEIAYAEFYFTPVLWPDFTPQEFEKALDNFALRHRRFGKL